MVFEGSPSWTMIKWYGSKNGLHISRKSRFLMVGMTMSSSSFNSGVFEVVVSAIVATERSRERERERGWDGLGAVMRVWRRRGSLCWSINGGVRDATCDAGETGTSGEVRNETCLSSEGKTRRELFKSSRLCWGSIPPIWVNRAECLYLAQALSCTACSSTYFYDQIFGQP